MTIPPKLIMCPNDFSDPSRRALETAVTLATKLGSALCLVHVVPAIPKLSSPANFFREGEYEEQLHKDAQNRLNELAHTIAASAGEVKTVVGTANDVSMELLRIAEHNHVDLIVIATHGMTGWHKLAFGSVADKVVRLATCPVLVFPAAQDTSK